MADWTYLRDIARELRALSTEMRIQNELIATQLTGDHDQAKEDLAQRRTEIQEERGT